MRYAIAAMRMKRMRMMRKMTTLRCMIVAENEGCSVLGEVGRGCDVPVQVAWWESWR